MKNHIPDYPRPQMIRPDWVNLNGTWQFAFDDANRGEKLGWQQGFQKQYDIQVPFTYETKMSGIGREEAHEHIWYERALHIKPHQGRVLLHFEGSDYHTRVFVNGHLAGEHFGGYARFSFDITDLVEIGDNRLVVQVHDSFDRSQPRGKQRWVPENFSCFYVQTTGIWKTVWLEYAPAVRVDTLKITPMLEEKAVRIEAKIEGGRDDMMLCAAVSFEGTPIRRAAASVDGGRVTLIVPVEKKEEPEWGIKKWTPQTPNLFDLEITLLDADTVCDRVLSYFGMREISIQGNQINLNGSRLYQRLILDQGYWKDSHLTPPSEEALIEDIQKIKQLGYNGLRKHQKTEDERFLYWCDVLGVLVWSEFPATYSFHDDAVENMTREWMEILRQNYNHPCIITWTPFNESWGVQQIATNREQQKFTEGIYHLTKAFDPMRPVIVNDGWEHTVSDIITLHDYEASGEVFYKYYTENKEAILKNEVPYIVNGVKYAFAQGYGYRGQPILISEFGGIAFNNDDSGWGYGGKVQDEAAFLQRFTSIVEGVQRLDWCCGFCYTQVTDVQQEINGLMDMERNFKVNPDVICAINKRRV